MWATLSRMKNDKMNVELKINIEWGELLPATKTKQNRGLSDSYERATRSKQRAASSNNSQDNSHTITAKDELELSRRMSIDKTTGPMGL